MFFWQIARDPDANDKTRSRHKLPQKLKHIQSVSKQHYERVAIASDTNSGRSGVPIVVRNDDDDGSSSLLSHHAHSGVQPSSFVSEAEYEW